MPSGPDYRVSSRKPIVFLGVICAIAFLVRVIHLRAQSIWHDEWVVLYYTDLPSVGFMLGELYANDFHNPGYFLLAYLIRSIYEDPNALRLMGVLAGVAVTPLLYSLGKEVSGAFAGLLAAALYAIAPYMIFESQGIRAYPLFLLLAVASTCAFVHALTKPPRPWLTFALAINVAMCWVHIFGLLLHTVQVFVLFFRFRKNLRLPVIWSALSFLLNIPVLAYAYSRLAVAAGGISPMHVKPSVRDLVTQFWGAESLALNPTLLVAWPPYVQEWPKLGSLIEGMGAAGVPAIFVLATLGACVLLWKRRKVRSAPPLLFVLLLATTPVLILFVVSHTLMPAFYPRYHVYTGPALFVLFGACVSSIRPKPLRAGAALAGLLVVGSQLLILIPGESRTQWNAVAAAVHEEPDTRRVYSNAFPVAQYYFTAHDIDTVPIESFHDLMWRVNCISKSQENGVYWAIWNLGYASTLKQDPVDIGSDFGLQVSVTHFQGMENLALVRIVRDANLGARTRDIEIASNIRDMYAGLPLSGLPEARTLETLQRITGAHEWGSSPFELAVIALFAIDACDLELARRCAEEALRSDPDLEFAWRMLLAIAVIQGGMREVDEKAEEWRRRLPPAFQSPGEAFLEAIRADDPGAARELARVLGRRAILFPERTQFHWGFPGSADPCNCN